MKEPAWQVLLDWWFGSDTTSAKTVVAQRNRLWFGKRPEQDREADERFGIWVRQAMVGDLDDWAQSPQSWLALLILLDQLPRMIYRDSPQAYAGDILAQCHMVRGLAKGFDSSLRPIEQVFVYLVLEHAEDLPSQKNSVERFTCLLDQASEEERFVFADFLDYAERHYDIIERFGRFPHRNEVLGRMSTPQEVAFLQTPGSGF